MKKKKKNLIELISMNLSSSLIYNVSDFDMINKVVSDIKELGLSYKNKNLSYYNSCFAFDIETTSFYQNGNKYANMYIWQMCINGVVFMGRTWNEFDSFLEILIKTLGLGEKSKILIYVHNLSYEFQFFRKRFEFQKVFALDNREVCFCRTYGLEFRCSYILTNTNLANLATKLTRFNVKKLVGDLDYNKPRHHETPLTNEELNYCRNDVIIIVCYIAELILMFNNQISNIPLTKTGFVRRKCRNDCLKSKNKRENQKYFKLMEELTLTPSEYLMANRAFCGGFTHANAFNQGKILNNVDSFDFCSSYPAVMVLERFPMSRGVEVDVTTLTKEKLVKYVNNYCCLIDIDLIGLCSNTTADDYLSLSHCYNVVKPMVNNGRISSAESLSTTITDVDLKIIKNVYDIKSMVIRRLIIYQKAYLPRPFIKSILDMYVKKTELKGVKGEEENYMLAKENLNACYGMSVTNIIRDEIIYNEEGEPWTTQEPCLEKEIKKYNKSKKRFLSYLWGVWVTAYARRNLWSGILEFGKTFDYIYSDTDSVKVTNSDKHVDYIKRYNDFIINKIKKSSKINNIDESFYMPKTIEGKTKIIGIWEKEEPMERFKTLGAKRYLVDYGNNDLLITVSGLNKKITTAYLKENYNDVFNEFKDGLYIPKGFTGKLTHTYIDEPYTTTLTDYLGNTQNVHEDSYIHLENTDYTLSLSNDYVNFLKSISIRKGV